MRSQSWLPDGTLVRDEEINLVAGEYIHYNRLTGDIRPATAEEIASLPDPDLARVEDLLSTSPAVITMPEMWELMRLFWKLR